MIVHQEFNKVVYYVIYLFSFEFKLVQEQFLKEI